MPATLDTPRRVSNGLLDALPPKELQRLQTHLEPATLDHSMTVFDTGQVLEYVYFPTTGVLSLVVLVPEHGSVEVGMVGHEGMACIASSLGIDHAPMRAYVQVPGDTLRLPTEVFRTEMQRHGSLYHLLQGYLGAYLFMVTQTAACNRFHSVDQRLCRWLLMAMDRSRGNQFMVTQEALANLLGVRRASITEAAVNMQDENVLRYRWGKVTVQNRSYLEEKTCECYKLIKERLEAVVA